MSVTLPPDPYYKVLVIDDEREFKDKSHKDMVAYARSSDEALEYLLAPIRWNQVWFDHDLGPDDDIRRVVEWIEAQAFEGVAPEIGCCYVQSRNPVGVQWITAALERYYRVILCQNDQLVVPKWALALREDADATGTD